MCHPRILERNRPRSELEESRASRRLSGSCSTGCRHLRTAGCVQHILFYGNWSVAGQAEDSAAANRRVLFQWFSGLGFADVNDAPFVRFPGSTLLETDKPPQIVFAHGFLLKDEKESWKILTFGLETRAVAKHVPLKRGSRSPPGIAKRSIWLHLPPPPFRLSGNESRPLTDPINKFSEPTKVFVLAWACWRKGLDQEATALFDCAARADSKTHDPAARAFVNSSADSPWSLANDQFTQIQLDLAYRQGSGKKLASARGPGTAGRKDRRGLPGNRGCLSSPGHGRDAQENGRRRSPARRFRKKEEDSSPSTLARQEQIAELIFQLREQGRDSGGTMRTAPPTSFRMSSIWGRKTPVRRTCFSISATTRYPNSSRPWATIGCPGPLLFRGPSMPGLSEGGGS